MFQVRFIRLRTQGDHAFFQLRTFTRHFAPFDISSEDDLFDFADYEFDVRFVGFFALGVLRDPRAFRRLIRIRLVAIGFQAVRTCRLHLSTRNSATNAARAHAVRRSNIR